MYRILIALLCLSTSLEAKYKPGIATLVEEHHYLQTEPADKYWAISSYYIPQYTDSSCSLAVATMLLNAQNALDNKVNTHLVTEKRLAKAFPCWGWPPLKDGLINGSPEKFSKIFGNSDDCSSMLTVDG